MSRPRIAALALLVLAALGLALALAERFVDDAGAELSARLEGRGRVALVSAALASAPPGTELVALSSLPKLTEALAGHDPEAVAQAMRDEELGALVVGGERHGGLSGPDASIEARLRAYARVPSLRALYLAPAGSIYILEPIPPLSAALRQALPRVAREILEGAAPPPLSAFPEPLRALVRGASVEVMVLLREGSQPRLWRSARASSIAAGLVTASSFARQRWQERERAMGGPLPRLLPSLGVEVSLLLEDGTLGARDPGFVERVFTPGFGVGFELRSSSWRYLLPSATRQEGSAMAAYQTLLAQSGLSESTLELPDCRLYRLAVEPLSVSPAPASRPLVLPD